MDARRMYRAARCQRYGTWSTFSGMIGLSRVVAWTTELTGIRPRGNLCPFLDSPVPRQATVRSVTFPPRPRISKPQKMRNIQRQSRRLGRATPQLRAFSAGDVGACCHLTTRIGFYAGPSSTLPERDTLGLLEVRRNSRRKNRFWISEAQRRNRLRSEVVQAKRFLPKPRLRAASR
jgi:hypothetical protein